MKVERRGFTLSEVMLALVISGIVLLVGRGVFDAVTETQGRLREARIARDRESNRAQWLREAFRTLDVGRDDHGSFDGGRERVAYSARLLNGRGWSEATRVTLEVVDGKLEAVLARGDTLQLDAHASRVSFDYLLEPGERARWVQVWYSPSTAPIAIRMRIEHGGPTVGYFTVDTLLLLVGERG